MSAPTIEPNGARALLDELTRRGAALHADGDRLAIDAPRGSIGDLLPTLARFKPQLLELLAAPGTATAPGTMASDGSDRRALELLATYRRGGALLELETIEHAGAVWLSLACDLTNVPRLRREHAFEQIKRNARQLQRALELEASPDGKPLGDVATARPKALPKVSA